jgi:uncharacterized membrane protein
MMRRAQRTRGTRRGTPRRLHRRSRMHKGRLEAFSDGVLAIIITIMVLELHPPHTAHLSALLPVLPTLLGYALSFVFIGIYWNNHHHLFQAAEMVDGKVLWANLHLLFWLSLLPFIMSWIGDSGLAPLPVAAYGVVLLMAGTAYYVLSHTLAALHGSGSAIARALGDDLKGKISLGIYIAALPLAFVHPAIAEALYFAVAIMWLVPDRRIERSMRHPEES